MIPPSIKAVSFDAGGTLFRPSPSAGHVYALAARRHGWGDLCPDELNSRFAQVWKEKRDFEYTRTDWASLVSRVFDGLVDQPDDAGFFDELYHLFAQAEHWKVFPDVHLTIEALQQLGFKLLIISNWDDRLHAMLNSMGLAACFETVVVSLEAGATKPAPEIFSLAARRMNLAPEEILHIGDSQLEDIDGAIQAGMHALRIERSSDATDPGVLSSLLDILPLESLPSLPRISGH